MGTKGIIQHTGDGVLYKGCEIEHSRKPFDGEEYIQVFLHYVDANGPFKEHVFDTHQPVETQIYRFVFGPNMFQNHVNYYKVHNALKIDTIHSLRSILDAKPLVEAHIGSGTLDGTKRRSKVYWLPKTDEFVEVYKTFHTIIGQCNDTFYRFQLSEIVEQIQYTVYTSEDEGHYDWHIDMGPNKANRKLSLVCQLSDPSEYEGGELQINTGNVMVVEKEQGTVILFPSFLLHRVTPVTKGVRRSLVLWIEGPPFV